MKTNRFFYLLFFAFLCLSSFLSLRDKKRTKKGKEKQRKAKKSKERQRKAKKSKEKQTMS
jgi:preprotein translocase subunit SecG